jgi:hypothetical protein
VVPIPGFLESITSLLFFRIFDKITLMKEMSEKIKDLEKRLLYLEDCL